MAVKGDDGHRAPRRTQAERRESTRAALLAAARELFAEKGYAGAGREEIVERAGVTRGAMHHHFGSKLDLFLAAYEAAEAEVMQHVAEAAMAAPADDPFEQLRVGALAYLRVAADPAVSRICLLDAPAVLAPDVRREVAERHATGVVREALRAGMAAGQMAERPVEPVAEVLVAAIVQAATLVAEGGDPDDLIAVVDAFLAGLRSSS